MNSVTAPPAPAMQFPFNPQKKGKADVSTYDVESPEMQSLALMESLEALKKKGEDDEEFVELDDIEKMMTTKRASRKTNGKKGKK